MRKTFLRRAATAVLLAVALSAAPHAAVADDHDPKRSGHPLRIAAYLAHPVGYAVDTLLFRPAHWLVHKGPLRTIFGHDGC